MQFERVLGNKNGTKGHVLGNTKGHESHIIE